MSTFDPSIFRAYDMRGTYPDQMNEEVAYAAGQAFVKAMNAKSVVVGRDVRATGVNLQQTLIKGVTDAGANVVEIGVISTEMLYYAAATLDCDGGMSITASHNPAQWNGIKFIGKNALPLTKDGPLGSIYELIQLNEKVVAPVSGTVQSQDLKQAYIAFLQEKFGPADLPVLKVVANTNFGANGKLVGRVVEGLPIELVRLNWNEDGTFPKGTPDPLLPKNRKEICELVVTEKAHFGVAWDADADRAFFYDEKGRFFHGYYVTAMLIEHLLKKEPSAAIVGERRLTWANLDAAKGGGGTLYFSRTGHGYIKAAMREHNAVFGGEVSGHYYYRDYFFCDSGLVTFLLVTAIFAEEIKAGRPVSELLDAYLTKYPISIQEMNYTTERAKEIIDSAAARYADADQNHEDGLSVEYLTWRCNIRMSSNEPVLRMNIEARSQEELDQRKKEIMDFIESFGAVLRDDEA